MYHDQRTDQQAYQSEMAEKNRLCREMDKKAMGGAIGSGLAGAIRPNSPLDDAIASVAAGVEDAFNALYTLAARLEPILQPECPMPVGAASGEVCGPPVSVAVARLRSQRSALEELVARTNSIRGRLDT